MISGCAEVFGAPFEMCAWGLCGFEWKVTMQTL